MNAPRPEAVDLDGVDLAGGDGVVWSLPHHGDLDANLVKLGPGGRVGEHHNDEVDVIILVIAGDGSVQVDGDGRPLRAHHLVHIPKGTRRGVEAGPDGLVYVTVHRARPGLRITPRH